MSHHPDHDKTGCGSVTGDAVDAAGGRQVFHRDATAWLAGQGVRYLHAANEEEELALRRVIELLQKMPGATAAIAQVFHDSPRDDNSLRWSILYLLAEVGDPSAIDVFYKAAFENLTSRDGDPQGCETPRDGEILVHTMAITGLARASAKNKAGVDMLYKLLESQPERALRIEIVKSIMELDPNGSERVKSILPKDLHYALDIKRVRAEVLAVEPEARAVDATRIAPELGSKPSSPRSSSCQCC